MRCGSNGLDTHEAIIGQACDIFYLPDTSGTRPCEFFAKCQHWMKKVIAEDEEPRELHRQYIEEKWKGAE